MNKAEVTELLLQKKLWLQREVERLEQLLDAVDAALDASPPPHAERRLRGPRPQVLDQLDTRLIDLDYACVATQRLPTANADP